METKMKIVLVLFVVVLLAYAIYYVMSDVNKQKASEQKDKRLVETFEEFDILKEIRRKLDKLNINKKTKTEMFKSLSGKIDTYKDMSPEDLNDMINEGIKALQQRYGVSSPSTARAPAVAKQMKEKYEEEQEEEEETPNEDVEETYEDDEFKSISKAFKPTRETFAKEDTFDEPAPVKRPPPKDNSGDIADILDSTSVSLVTMQRNLDKLKNILVAQNPQKAAPAKPTKPMIEGFENRSSNSYAAYF